MPEVKRELTKEGWKITEIPSVEEAKTEKASIGEAKKLKKELEQVLKEKEELLADISRLGDVIFEEYPEYIKNSTLHYSEAADTAILILREMKAEIDSRTKTVKEEEK